LSCAASLEIALNDLVRAVRVTDQHWQALRHDAIQPTPHLGIEPGHPT
jgi:hypothetical protein